MRIAIVDDVASERNILRGRLEAQLARLGIDGEILEFETGRAFLAAAAQEGFTLVFLDIYLEGENGVDTAKALRQFDSACMLVFTTSSTDYALEGFRVRALQYLVKPYREEELTALFDEITARLPAPDPYLDVKVVGGTVRIRLGEILYAEHYQHQIHIYTSDGKKTITRQTFRAFSESLTEERFFLCGRGILVNLQYVEDFDGTDFILKNGKRLPVSRDLSKAARLAFGDFLFKRGQEHA